MTELPISRDYAGSVCEIKNTNNILIAIGKISGVTNQNIKITSQKSELRVMNFGEKLKVNIFNTRLGFKVIVGNVYTSTRNELILFDISIIADKERRNFFRVDMNVDAKLIFRARGGSEKLDVKILDMSLSGLRFKSSHNFSEGEVVAITMNLASNNRSAGKEYTLTCKIVRIIDNTNGRELQYGCEFTDNYSDSSDALCSFLFQKQREFLNSRK